MLLGHPPGSRLRHPTKGCRSIQSPVSADFRSASQEANRKSQQLKAPWLSIKKLGLDGEGVKAMMHGAQKSGG